MRPAKVPAIFLPFGPGVKAIVALARTSKNTSCKYVYRYSRLLIEAKRGPYMFQLLQSTWPLLWVLILLLIFRWFHVVAASSRLPDDEAPEPRATRSTAIDFS